MTVKGRRNITFLERGRKDIERYLGKWFSQFEPSCRPVASIHSIAKGAKCAPTHFLIASCIASNLPTKKWSAFAIQTNSAGAGADLTTASTWGTGPYWSRSPLTKSLGALQLDRNS